MRVLEFLAFWSVFSVREVTVWGGLRNGSCCSAEGRPESGVAVADIGECHPGGVDRVGCEIEGTGGGEGACGLAIIARSQVFGWVDAIEGVELRVCEGVLHAQHLAACRDGQ